MTTIMHISDLHRTAESFNSNDDLLSALIRDSVRYQTETHSISKPDIIIVSGDIIQGAKLDDPEYENILTKQYEEAKDFLESLCAQFLEGKKKNLVIVPGNHDVNWKTAYAAMTKIESTPNDLLKLLQRPETSYRWSWKELCAYKIEDKELYASKFSNFNKFLTEFYKDSELEIYIKADRDWNIFPLNELEIAVVGFNSAIYNDCFYFPGCIRQSAISSSDIELKKYPNLKLQIAVWHHNTTGGPFASNYLDRNILPAMVDAGFRIGLHGHQHFAEIDPFTITLEKDYSMAIISAGSLCAADSDLPHSQNRNYNLIQIDEKFSSVRVNVREMSIPGIFSASRRPGQSDKTYALSPKLGSPNISLEKKESGLNTMEFIQKAEEMLREKKFSLAKSFIELNSADFKSQYGRRLSIQIYFHGKYWVDLVQAIDAPENNDELAMLFTGLIEQKEYDICEAMLMSVNDRDGIEPKLLKDLKNRLSALRRSGS
jgi:hypothetical protein